MPAFYLLLVIFCILLWLCASALYKPIGFIVKKLINDSIDIMSEKD